jgi:hypothetical protein
MIKLLLKASRVLNANSAPARVYLALLNLPPDQLSESKRCGPTAYRVLHKRRKKRDLHMEMHVQ